FRSGRRIAKWRALLPSPAQPAMPRARGERRGDGDNRKQERPVIGAFFYHICRLSRGSGIDFRSLRLRRFCEPLTKRAKILELGFRKLMIPLAEIPQGIVKPLDLVLRLGADDAATHDMLEQLIAGLLEHCGLRNLSATTRLLFVHEFLE